MSFFEPNIKYLFYLIKTPAQQIKGGIVKGWTSEGTGKRDELYLRDTE